MNYNRPCFNKNLGERAYIAPKKHKPIDPVHKGHELKSSLASGPHYAKLTCVTCNKFVKWLNVEEAKKYP